jgi:hypothetical protein
MGDLRYPLRSVVFPGTLRLVAAVFQGSTNNAYAFASEIPRCYEGSSHFALAKCFENCLARMRDLRDALQDVGGSDDRIG